MRNTRTALRLWSDGLDMTILNDLHQRAAHLEPGAELWITETEAQLLLDTLLAFAPSLGLNHDIHDDPPDTLPLGAHFMGHPIYIVQDQEA